MRPAGEVAAEVIDWARRMSWATVLLLSETGGQEIDLEGMTVDELGAKLDLLLRSGGCPVAIVGTAETPWASQIHIHPLHNGDDEARAPITADQIGELILEECARRKVRAYQLLPGWN
jgi:hypothetical protein